jgi:hypothetical protein
VSGSNGITKHPTEADARGIEHDVDEVREHLGALMGELNRRRREAMDVKLQYQRHPVRMVLGAVVFVTLVAGTIALLVARRHHRRSLAGRAQRMRRALHRVAERPELIADPEPTVSHKVAVAGGTALASILGKQLAKKLVSA